MPQSLIQTSAAAGQPLRHGGALLIASHEQIVGLLRSRLGSNQAMLLAKPRIAADGSIAWSTVLEGPVVRESELGGAERADLHRLFDRYAGNIRTLAQSLAVEGQDGLAWSRLLDLALTRPAGDWLFSVDGRPVLAMWGHVGPADALPADTVHRAVPPSAPAIAASAPAAQPTPAQPQAAAPVMPAKAHAAGTRPAWLPAAVSAFGLLTLALVAFAVWKLSGSDLWPGAADVDARITAAESRNAELQTRLQARTALQCLPDDPAAAAGQPGAPPSASPAPQSPAGTAPGASAQGGQSPAAPVPAPAAPPQMPELPKLPNVPAAPPASRTIQLPSTSGHVPPSDDGVRLARALRTGLHGHVQA